MNCYEFKIEGLIFVVMKPRYFYGSQSTQAKLTLVYSIKVPEIIVFLGFEPHAGDPARRRNVYTISFYLEKCHGICSYEIKSTFPLKPQLRKIRNFQSYNTLSR